MNEIYSRLAKLSPEQRKHLEQLIREDQQLSHKDKKTSNNAEEEPIRSEILVSYYSSLSKSSKLHSLSETRYWTDDVIRFSPFSEIVPGFSWILLQFEPEKYSEHAQRALEAQEEMKRVLFRGLNFSSFTKVLDIGCGYSSDLIALAKKYPHLELHGYNISPDQVEISNQKIKASDLSDRIKLYNADSTKEPFPDQYDLAMSFQVIHHIRNKNDVLKNVSDHLNNGGYFVLSEIMSNLMTSPINAPESSAYFVPRDEWAKMLAQNHLRVVEGVDASLQIGNFLYDPNFIENFSRVTQNYDENTKTHLQGPHQLGELLRKKLALYAVLMVQKDKHLTQDTILRLNREKLASFVPYLSILKNGKTDNLLLLSNQVVEKFNIQAQSTNGRDKCPFTKEVILAKDPSQRQLLLELYLREQIARLMGIDPYQLEPKQPLDTFGINSLMALELKNQIEVDLQIEVPVTKLYEANSIAQFTATILDQITAGASTQSSGTTYEAREMGEMLVEIEELSEEEVQTRLDAEKH